MKHRLARLGVLAIAVVGLVAGSAVPAGATTVGVVAFTGTATVSNGIAYPCLDGKTTPPTINTQKCGGNLTSNNTATVTFNGDGVGTVANGPNKTKPNTFEAGTFSITGTGNVIGACGLSRGSLGGAVTPVISVGTKAKVRNYAVTFDGIGGLLVLQGSTTKAGGPGETFVGVAVAIADPTRGSCTNKAPKVFIVAGAIVLVRVP